MEAFQRNICVQSLRYENMKLNVVICNSFTLQTSLLLAHIKSPCDIKTLIQTHVWKRKADEKVITELQFNMLKLLIK